MGSIVTSNVARVLLSLKIKINCWTGTIIQLILDLKMYGNFHIYICSAPPLELHPKTEGHAASVLKFIKSQTSQSITDETKFYREAFNGWKLYAPKCRTYTYID